MINFIFLISCFAWGWWVGKCYREEIKKNFWWGFGNTLITTFLGTYALIILRIKLGL